MQQRQSVALVLLGYVLIALGDEAQALPLVADWQESVDITLTAPRTHLAQY